MQSHPAWMAVDSIAARPPLGFDLAFHSAYIHIYSFSSLLLLLSTIFFVRPKDDDDASKRMRQLSLAAAEKVFVCPRGYEQPKERTNEPTHAHARFFELGRSAMHFVRYVVFRCATFDVEEKKERKLSIVRQEDDDEEDEAVVALPLPHDTQKPRKKWARFRWQAPDIDTLRKI